MILYPGRPILYRLPLEEPEDAFQELGALAMSAAAEDLSLLLLDPAGIGVLHHIPFSEEPLPNTWTWAPVDPA